MLIKLIIKNNFISKSFIGKINYFEMNYNFEKIFRQFFYFNLNQNNL